MSDFKTRAFAKITPASRFLQAFTSRGKVHKKKVEKAQKAIDTVKDNVDITEFCEQHFTEIEAVLNDIKGEKDHEEIKENATASIANFIASVGTFSSSNYTSMSSVILRWLESVEVIDKDVTDIIDRYQAALKQVINNDALTDAHADAFTQEMQKACDRYFAKHSELKITQEVSNNHLLYVSEANMNRGGDIADEAFEQPDFITDKDDGEE